jgi:hypothetical protein
LFDYPKRAEPPREEPHVNAERLAAEAALSIAFIRGSKAFHKDERIQEILAEREGWMPAGRSAIAGSQLLPTPPVRRP